ncbi:sulfatase [Pelagicoccus mobilis]|uniref:Sulfatase n=1 Tax=Pelagicoccus mobilis TaxID=415221 RepID=A0A934RYB0_9BACT|nr:sulfatase [Pelagicoccus mobilis]MBK1876099.1 sulfatase [Pelagicoccus mobilis]
MLAVFAGLLLIATGIARDKPNVVLIICDDLNDYVSGFGGHPQVQTPNLERFAKTGVSFSRAYSNYPVCAPSRSSFLTGIHARTSGNLHFDKWYENPVLSNSKTLMEHFRDNGYHVVGSGKVMHHFKRDVWDEFENETDYGPFVYDGNERVAHPSVPSPFADIPNRIDGSFAPLEDIPYANDDDPTSGWVYGDESEGLKPFNYASDGSGSQTPDEMNADWAANRLEKFAQEEGGKPFFLAVGFIRPHTPLHVAKRYFDRFPKDTLQLPVMKPGDKDDISLNEVFGREQLGRRYYRVLTESYSTPEDGIRAFTQAYLASVAAVDENVGQVIDAVDQSRLKDNTVVIVMSDHGWQMGEKDYLFKSSPYEESTRIPFLVRAPGVTPAGEVADQVVSLIDLYPTLVELCGLEGDTRKNDKGAPLEGSSFVSLLKDPIGGKWSGPEEAVSMIWAWLKDAEGRKDPDQQHWTIRSKRWRYIRYSNGSEELYDHDRDPYEWDNLSSDPEHAPALSRLRASLEKLQARKRID